MQVLDSTLISFWLIFILEVIIALLLFSEKRKIRRFENEYKKMLHTTQEHLDAVLQETAKTASQTLSKISDAAKKSADSVQDTAESLQKELASALLFESKNELEALQEAAKKQAAELSKELAAATAHTKSEMHQVHLAHTQQATQEVTAYKKEQMQHIASEATRRISLVTKRYLQEELSTEQIHQICLKMIAEEISETPNKKNEADR